MPIEVKFNTAQRWVEHELNTQQSVTTPIRCCRFTLYTLYNYIVAYLTNDNDEYWRVTSDEHLQYYSATWNSIVLPVIFDGLPRVLSIRMTMTFWLFLKDRLICLYLYPHRARLIHINWIKPIIDAHCLIRHVDPTLKMPIIYLRIWNRWWQSDRSVSSAYSNRKRHWR